MRSLWPSNVLCKTAFPRVLDLPNRVEEVLTSLPGERPCELYVLIRVYKTWVTKKKGLKREKWEQKLMTIRGRTPMEAARKLKRRIEKKELLPFSVAGSEADDLRKICKRSPL